MKPLDNIVTLPGAAERQNDVLVRQLMAGQDTAQLMFTLAKELCRATPDAVQAVPIGFDVPNVLLCMGQLRAALASAHTTVGIAVDRLRKVVPA